MVTTLYGHNPLWGSNDTNNKGKHIEDMLSDHQLFVLMMVQILTCILQVEHILPLTYLLVQDFKWYVHDDLCGSDHFPTVLESFTPCPTNSVPRWNFNKADWDRFVGLCKEKITADTFQHDTDPIESFSNLTLFIKPRQFLALKSHGLHRSVKILLSIPKRPKSILDFILLQLILPPTMERIITSSSLWMSS